MRNIRLLGPACIERIPKTRKNEENSGKNESNAGTLPRFRSRRTAALLGYLAVERRPVARDFLAALFWPDEASTKGRANLRRELHNLVQILPGCWQADRQAVAFVPSPGTTVDLDTLLELEAEERWGEAAELLSGEFLEGLYLDDNPEFENWLLGERERWRGRAETVLGRVIEGSTRRGRYADSLRHARRLLQIAPWDEDTHRHIMRLLAWTGQRGAAIRQFETCKQALRRELDVEPAPETTALFHQIQAGKLDLPPQLPAFLTGEKARHAFERRPFVGREVELAQLDAFIDQALNGQGQVIFITGGPGRGKTAILDAFARRAMEAHPNLLVARGKCNAYSGLGDPYLPYRDMMAMLTGDVEGRWDAGVITPDHAQRLWAAFPLVTQALLDHGPHLVDVLAPGEGLLSRAAIIEGGGAPWLPRLRELVNRRAASPREVDQSHHFQQVTDVLRTAAQEQPLLLILDDIQWADAASISLLFHLGRRLAGSDSRLLIACAYRPEEVSLDRDGKRHPLAKVLSEFKRAFGDVWVHLGRADETRERQFVDALLDVEANRLGERFRASLFDRTAGHPLFTIELLDAMQGRGDLLKDEDGAWIEGPTLDWDVLPARVEAVIEERIDRLDPELQDLLTIASVEGEVFTAQVLAGVRDAPESSTLRQLSQDLERRHRLVKELGEVQTSRRRLSRYRFGHALFQDFLYKRLPQGERRLLHAEVAGTLEKFYEGELEEMAVQLAQHYHQAGNPGRAFDYFSLAGERASRLYAYDDAVKHYTQAVELAVKVSPDVVSLARLHRGRGLASEWLGAFNQARNDHEATLQIARSDRERQVEWRALLDLGKLWRSRDYDQARDCFEAALELARQMDDPAVLAKSLNWMGNWCANVEIPLRAVEYHREALKIVEQWGDQRELAITLDLLGIAHLLGGDTEISVQYYNRAIVLFRELDDRPRLVTSLLGRASNFSMLGLLAAPPTAPPRDPAIDLNEGLRIAMEIDSAPDQAWAHWALGQLHTKNGQFGHALKDGQSGLHIASEIGHREFVVANRFGLGELYNELLAPDRARVELEEALTLARELHSQNLIHDVTGALAEAYILLDDLPSAQACLEAALSPGTPMDTLGIRYCWTRRGELALAQGDPALALDITERLIASAPGASPGRVITFLWKIKAEALAAMSHTQDAVPLLHAALESAREVGERFLLWRVHASLGRLYQAMGRQTQAQEEFSAAHELIQELAATIPDQALKENFLQRAGHTIFGN